MSAEYETFVDRLESLKQGVETELIVRDTVTYESKRVRAVLSPDRGDSSAGNTLWVRFNQGVLHRRPWKILIKEDLGSPLQNIG